MIPALVSVIIPTYNRRQLVLDAVESVQSQTYRNFEILVVDDGSTDGTAEIVRGLDLVRCVHQERAGPAAARTCGLKVARGQFVASLDSDDVWSPTFLEESVAIMQRFSLDFVFSNWSHDSGEPSYFSRWQRRGRLGRYCRRQHDGWCLLEPQEVRHLFLRSCLAPSSSMLLRRSSMPSSWNSEMRMADDWYLILEMVLTRPTHAAFTTAIRWRKRLDGTNRYDGQHFLHVVRDLYLHDHGAFRRDFRWVLSRRERMRFASRQTGYLVVMDILRSLRDRLGG